MVVDDKQKQRAIGFSDSQWEAIKRTAKKRGMSATGYVRYASLRWLSSEEKED